MPEQDPGRGAALRLLRERGRGRLGASLEQRNADALIELCARRIASGKLPRQAGRSPQLTEVPLCRFSHHPLATEGGYLLRAGPGGIFELVRPGAA